MKRFLILIFFLFGFIGLAQAQNLETLLQNLDRMIQDKDSYGRNKEERINAIRSTLGGNKTDRYSVYDALYHEYAKYDLDSALHYARKKAAIAKVEGGNNSYWEASCMQLADIYTNTGQYLEAENLLEEVKNHNAMYFHGLHTLYTAMAATSVLREKKEAYTKLKNQYRDSLIQHLPANDVGYIFAQSEKLNDQGRYYDAIVLLTKRYNDPQTQWKDKAILDYCMAISYKGLGNREKAKWHYASSAIADIRTQVKEYRSLQELSYMLYEDGDLTRAYRYITCAMEDVMASNTMVRSMEFTPFLSTIGNAYEKDIEKRTKIQSRLMLGLSILLLLLVLTIIMVMRQHYLVSSANRALMEKNEELKLISQKLRETGYLKEEYLYQYMEQASAGIDRMESYRRKLLLSYRKYGADQMASELETPLDVDAELRNFYNSFDETFIHLFPTFVEDVNRLLKPQSQLEPKPGRLMNTELRILALVRLGVTDNVKIAHFLRASLSTIYNYRSKLRNAALKDDVNLEEELAKIGEIKIDRHE